MRGFEIDPFKMKYPYACLAGKAAPAEFTSEPQGYEPNKFLVEWTVQSYSPVSKFLLRFRSHSDSEWREIQVSCSIGTSPMTCLPRFFRA